MTRFKIYVFQFVLLLLVFGCGNNSKNPKVDDDVIKQIMVFSAASLTDVLGEIADSFEVKYRIDVQLNMASSGTLARQITQGETPDVYISASKQWAAYIDSLGYTQQEQVSVIAKNELVLVVPFSTSKAAFSIDSTADINSLLLGGRLSIGDPAHVPAGKYAKQSLEYFGWYKSVEQKILPAKDVRSALMVVEMGEAPLGIVYRTDAQKSGKVQVLSTFPSESHDPIIYVAGVCSDNAAAKEFFSYLNSEEANKLWVKHGFEK